MIEIIRSRATPEQMQEMLEKLGIYIKLAVDTQQAILAGGGELHADCEQVLLKDGSKQSDIWGADWYPTKQIVGYESLFDPAPITAQWQFKTPSCANALARSLMNFWEVWNGNKLGPS